MALRQCSECNTLHILQIKVSQVSQAKCIGPEAASPFALLYSSDSAFLTIDVENCQAITLIKRNYLTCVMELWSPWQSCHALNSMFYTQNASSSNSAFIQHLDLKITEFV